MSLNPFFWNVIGTASLGFSSFVLIANLGGSIGNVVMDLMQTDQVWIVLANPYLAPYGAFLIIVSGVVCFIIIKRATARNMIGPLQLAAAAGAGSTLALWNYLV